VPATDHAALRLVRRPAVGTDVPALDPVQAQVVDRRAGSGPLVVVGAPGTGKTTTLVEAVAARVHRDGLDPSSVLVLAPTRVAAAALRQRVSARLAGLGPVAVGEPLARTPASYAFGLIRRSAVRAGDPSPRLISGPEQDAVLRDLLEGHVEGEGTPPRWPSAVRPALALSGLRAELRELLMRAMERGLGPDGLVGLARRHGRPEWEAAATLLGEYLDVTALRSPSAFDPAGIVDEAVSLLREDRALLAAERERWRVVAVDDHHESVEATSRLLEQLCGRGADLLVTGDPDATTGGFRGADPGAVSAASSRHRTADGAEAPVVVLPTRWRSGPAVTEVSRRVAAAVGGGTQVVARRGAVPGRARDAVEVAVLGSQHAQAAYVAGLLRRAHVSDDVPWGEMAVLVRSSGRTAVLRRALAAAGVPVGTGSSEAPVRDEPAVRPLLLAAAASLRPEGLDAAVAGELLQSPLGGADALEVRRLRQRLLAGERAAGGARASDALVVEALLDPVEAVPAARGGDDALRRVAAVLAAGRREVAAAGTAAGPSAERLLWALWDASGLGERWRAVALAGGRRGRRADRDLDAVVALFEAAQRFSERLPGAGAQSFLDTLGQQDVPSDTLAERAPQHDAVAVLTPQSAVGRQWRVVVVSDVQDGVWPNTRLRGSLLGAPDLVDAVAGVHLEQEARVRAARLAVQHDELRMLHVAVTRARERLVVTAVRDADDVPSPFLDLVDPLPDDVDERRLTPVPRTTSLRAVVADLRARLLRAISDDDAALVDELAALLARLADEGVPGADPASWYGTQLSDDEPLQAPDAQVTVSPSAIEKFEGCPLRWLLETSGGKDGASGTAAGVGSIVHALAHEMASLAGDLDSAALRERLEDELGRRWPSLGLQGWVGRKEEARARGMVGLLAGYLQDRAGALVGTELDLRVQVGRAVLTGRVDRLETDDDGRLLVVDLKTSKYPPTAERIVANPQLGAYQVAVEEGAFGEREPGGASLVHLGRKDARSVSVQTQPPPARADDPAWARTMVARAADGMAGAAFEARVSSDCDRCPVRSSCPAQPDGEQLATGAAR
jgi:superfamily I DNA/RNA helicase/RecB family exonuclease